MPPVHQIRTLPEACKPGFPILSPPTTAVGELNMIITRNSPRTFPTGGAAKAPSVAHNPSFFDGESGFRAAWRQTFSSPPVNRLRFEHLRHSSRHRLHVQPHERLGHQALLQLRGRLSPSPLPPCRGSLGSHGEVPFSSSMGTAGGQSLFHYLRKGQSYLYSRAVRNSVRMFSIGTSGWMALHPATT